MKTIQLGCKRLIAAAVVAAALAAKADTVVWYTFDDLGDVGDTVTNATTVVNKANPGTLDATMYGMYGTTKTPDTNPAWMPYVTNGVPESLRVLDPVGGTMASAADKALHFKRTHGAGSGAMLEIPNDPALRPSSFTVETFIRLDPTQSNWEMLACQPSATAGLYGWGINIYRPVDNSYVNFMLNFVDTAGGNHQHGIGASQNSNVILDYKWHHIALAVTPQSGDPSKINIKFFIDYVRVYNYDAPYGIVLPDSADCPVQIGGTTMEGQLFADEIGEFRFSDKALDIGEFLRPHNAEIDKDVVLYYDFEDFSEDWSWFSAGSGDVVNKANPGIMDGTFVTRNAYSPEFVDDSPAERLRQSMLDPTYENSEKALQNRIIDADHRQTGYLMCTPLDEDWLAKTNFTIETFFKTSNQSQPYVALFQRNGGFNVQLKFGINSNGGMLGINISTNTAAQVEQSWYTFKRDEWHHAALVVNQTGEAKTITLYIDGLKKNSMSLDSNLTSLDKAGITHNGTWYFAGSTGNSFDGMIDSVRVTLRALAPEEFLTSQRYPEGRTIAHLKFDDGTANAADGGGALFDGAITGSAFSDSVPGYKITDGESGTVLSKPDVASLSIVNNSEGVHWTGLYDQYYLRKDINGVERTSGTVELWVKASTPRQFGAILDAKLTANGNYNDNMHAWKLGLDNGEGTNPSIVFLYLKSDGTRPGHQRVTANVNVIDGKWHHWAFTFKPNASDPTKSDIDFYLDYNKIACNVETLDGRVAYDDTLRFSLGEAGSSVAALIDEVRISDCVLDPSEFLRAEKQQGLILIFR